MRVNEKQFHEGGTHGGCSIESDCGSDNIESAEASTPQSSFLAGNQSFSTHIKIPTVDPNRLDIVVLSKVLFERARMHSSLQLIPSVQRELIVNALHETGGNYVQAAKLLGITRPTLRKRLEQFRIKQHFSVH